eukprot:8533261-Alexandrium_andersonii.AAC.1
MLVHAVDGIRPRAARTRKRLADALPDEIQHRLSLARPAALGWQIAPPLAPPVATQALEKK